MTAPRCQLHICDATGAGRRCNALAVSIWRANDGDQYVCEQCEALITDAAKGGTMAAVFEPFPA